MTAINSRWYSAAGSLLFTHTPEMGGEVRVHLVDPKGEGQAYIMAGPVEGLVEQSQFISNQLNGVVANEVYPEDFTWVQEMIDVLLVPDERCRVAWGACRGSMKNNDTESFHDVIALIIAADLFIAPDNSTDHFRIATFPIGPWEYRRVAVEQALRSMALQRFAREAVMAQAARNSDADVSPLPGLRLTRPIEREISDDQYETFVDETRDLCSERGGLDYVPSDA